MNDVAMRLRQAREAAGFGSAQEAASRFGWTYATYAGHENGHRGIRLEALQKYARAFKVDMGWLLSGRSSGIAPLRHDLHGFAETDVLPFRAATPDQERTVESLAKALIPSARHHQLLRVNRDYPAFCILKGDILVIGSLPEKVSHLVVATIANESTFETNTVLRQVAGGVLVAPLGYAIDGEQDLSTGILGTVLAVIRSPESEVQE